MDLSQYLDFAPTKGQEEALSLIAKTLDPVNKNDFFILNGYAGTGKTSIVKAVTDYLTDVEIDFRLNAPTGSAAKIIANKAGHTAGTMHGCIYNLDKDFEGDGVNLLLKLNDNKKYTIFIVDESSMVSDWKSNDKAFITPNALLYDYVQYVKQGNSNNKVLFIGDNFQLPPFANGEQKSFSPALSESHLITNYGWTGETYTLTEVKRQAGDSEVLSIATDIRSTSGLFSYHSVNIPMFKSDNYSKSYSKAIREYINAFESENIHKQIVINNSNRSVSWWNKVIRERLRLDSSMLSVGDFVVLQRNWISEEGSIFLKGEMGVVSYVSSPSKTYGCQQFCNVHIDFIERDGSLRTAKSMVLLKSLTTDYGLLHSDDEKTLIAEVNKTNSKYRETKNIFDDPHLGAMRLRHAFAITCHKAQGGEWDKVFIEPSSPQYIDKRWLYTAVTRARNEVISWAA